MIAPLPSVTLESKYRERMARWDALWALEDVAKPAWLISTQPSLVPIIGGRNPHGDLTDTSAAAPFWLANEYPLTRYFSDKEMQLRGQLEALAWRDTLQIDDPFIPYLQPMGGVTVFASAFGCKVDFFPHTLPWAHPVIGAGEPAERVYDLPHAGVRDGQLGEMLEFTDYFMRETQGRYPIGITDMQGPMDSAYLVWNSSDFMMAMYSNPKEVHHLMRRVTDLIIAYVKEQRRHSAEFLPCHYPPLWARDGWGISMSDDALAVLSPSTYREFALPYANELSEEFGGIFIHSCGNFKHQLKNLKKVRGLRGLNFGATEMPFEAVWERFGGKCAVVPHLGLNKDLHFDSRLEYVEYVLQRKTHNRGLMVVVDLLPDDLGRVEEIAGGVDALAERYA